MANEKLRHKKFRIPKKVLVSLKHGYQRYQGPEKVEGYLRTQHLIGGKKISYELLKKVKHFFDHYQGSEKSPVYHLNGGDTMRHWVNRTLAYARRLANKGKSSSLRKLIKGKLEELNSN